MITDNFHWSLILQRCDSAPRISFIFPHQIVSMWYLWTTVLAANVKVSKYVCPVLLVIASLLWGAAWWVWAQDMWSAGEEASEEEKNVLVDICQRGGREIQSGVMQANQFCRFQFSVGIMHNIRTPHRTDFPLILFLWNLSSTYVGGDLVAFGKWSSLICNGLARAYTR
jgi:hypothetical protein